MKDRVPLLLQVCDSRASRRIWAEYCEKTVISLLQALTLYLSEEVRDFVAWDLSVTHAFPLGNSDLAAVYYVYDSESFQRARELGKKLNYGGDVESLSEFRTFAVENRMSRFIFSAPELPEVVEEVAKQTLDEVMKLWPDTYPSRLDLLIAEDQWLHSCHSPVQADAKRFEQMWGKVL